MMVYPITDIKTGNEIKFDPGWNWVSFLYDLVYPMVPARGIIMNKSM